MNICRSSILKVTRVVNLKLAFTDWFSYKFDNTNQVMQNPILKFRQLFQSAYSRSNQNKKSPEDPLVDTGY